MHPLIPPSSSTSTKLNRETQGGGDLIFQGGGTQWAAIREQLKWKFFTMSTRYANWGRRRWEFPGISLAGKKKKINNRRDFYYVFSLFCESKFFSFVFCYSVFRKGKVIIMVGLCIFFMKKKCLKFRLLYFGIRKWRTGKWIFFLLFQ